MQEQPLLSSTLNLNQQPKIQNTNKVAPIKIVLYSLLTTLVIFICSNLI